MPNLGHRGAEWPGRFDVSSTNCEMWCMSGALSGWSCRSPVARSCSLLNYPNRFCGGMFKLHAKCDAETLLYLLSHFECNGHTVHMLTQWCLPPPLTSAVKSSLLMHVHSSPLSLASRSHRCCTNCSCYINNGWTFSGKTWEWLVDFKELVHVIVAAGNSEFCWVGW